MRAGPSWLAVRFTVMETVGLWYFRRGRQLRQNFLEMGGQYVQVWCKERAGSTGAHSVHRECSTQSPCVFD